MFWNDLKDIKEWMVTISARLTEMQMKHLDKEDKECCCLEDIENRLGEILETCENTEEEIPRLATLVNPDDIVAKYEKHLRKIEEMMLEFKGCVSLARAAVAERKVLDKELEDIKNVCRISKDIYDSMKEFINAGNQLESKNYFKLDAIYRKICEIDEEKPKKKGKPRKKVTSPSA